MWSFAPVAPGDRPLSCNGTHPGGWLGWEAVRSAWSVRQIWTIVQQGGPKSPRTPRWLARRCWEVKGSPRCIDRGRTRTLPAAVAAAAAAGSLRPRPPATPPPPD